MTDYASADPLCSPSAHLLQRVGTFAYPLPLLPLQGWETRLLYVGLGRGSSYMCLKIHLVNLY